MCCGVILLDKEPGCSSAQAVGAIKKRLSLRKIGHAGTLDPMASGLLVCLCGGATRLADYASRGRKTYSGEIELGLATDSDDITGREISRSADLPAWKEIEGAAAEFLGRRGQVPPKISAIKLSGRRAYELARKGEDPELSPRSVELFSLHLTPAAGKRVAFQLSCSKGFYVRSLARDLGLRLGCGAALAALRREGSEPFGVHEAGRLDDLGRQDIRPIESIFPACVRLELEHEAAQRLLRGDTEMLYSLSVKLNKATSGSEALYFDRQRGRFCGLLVKRDGQWSFGVNVPEGE